ncbi:MAG: peptidylprolyl isomerase [Proteobacteria bacterium]|nr:peptidylprolyl isomerase [Pseudomonadota bacterium]
MLVAALAAGGLDAQEVQRIVAVVNDDVISNYDLQNRLRLALANTGLEDTAENRRRLQPQVLRGLIDEKLQLQEAQRLSLSVTDTEVDQATSKVEEQNRLPRGGLDDYLRRISIEKTTLTQQIRATLAWNKVATRRQRQSLQVGEDEVDEVFAKFNSSQGSTEMLLAEIFLAIDSPDQEDEVKQTAQRLIEQMGRGVPFSGLARQFSQSASAAAGGDIGWIQKGQLDEEIEAAIDQLQADQISEPIRTVAGYYIYIVRQRRTIAAPSPDEAKVTLAQLVLPLEPAASADDVQAQTGLAEQVREAVSGCADFERVAKELGLPKPEMLPSLRIADLNPTIRSAVAALKVGEAGAPAKVEPGLLMLMVCVREEPPSNLPSREDITDNLTRQRLDLLMRRYLRDLRRAAVVDVRA